MISEQAALGRPVAARRSAVATPWRERISARPAIAGRERIAEALGQSVLVQLMLAMSFAALAALLYMAQAGQVSVQQMNISSLQSERMTLVAANAGYRTTATSLQSLTRIDNTATSQLHMVPAPPGTKIWLYPVVPRVPAITPVNADTVAAQNASQPLAWMQRVVQFVRSSL